jgi:hypothetical protein
LIHIKNLIALFWLELAAHVTEFKNSASQGGGQL